MSDCASLVAKYDGLIDVLVEALVREVAEQEKSLGTPMLEACGPMRREPHHEQQSIAISAASANSTAMSVSRLSDPLRAKGRAP
jgi:hypothetical protein